MSRQAYNSGGEGKRRGGALAELAELARVDPRRLQAVFADQPLGGADRLPGVQRVAALVQALRDEVAEHPPPPDSYRLDADKPGALGSGQQAISAAGAHTHLPSETQYPGTPERLGA
jgi:hypothetical protein